MPYIGKSPVGGGFHKLDNLTASATATYALTLGGAAYYPETANQLLVSLNGVIQAPQDSFTVSGSNLVFDSALTASDSIDFVVALGDVLGVQGVTDGTVTTAKIANGAVTTAKIANNAVTDAKIDTMAASKLTGALPAIDGSALTGIGGGAGSIVKTVYQELTSVVTITSTSWVDIGLSASITPSSASNYLLITPNVNINQTNSGSYAFLDLTDSSNVSVVNHTDALGSRSKGFGRTIGLSGVIGIQTLEHNTTTIKVSPATTSQVTYKVRARVDGASAKINTNGADDNGAQTIRTVSGLMITEIAG